MCGSKEEESLRRLEMRLLGANNAKTSSDLKS